MTAPISKPTHCMDCERPIKQNRNCTRLRCPGCVKAYKVVRMARFYAERRKDNPAWKKKNKRRAKAWRERNPDRVARYEMECRP
jgi:hypothetical protein